MLRGKQLLYGKAEDVQSMHLASTLYRLVRTLSTPVQERNTSVGGGGDSPDVTFFYKLCDGERLAVQSTVH